MYGSAQVVWHVLTEARRWNGFSLRLVWFSQDRSLTRSGGMGMDEAAVAKLIKEAAGTDPIALVAIVAILGLILAMGVVRWFLERKTSPAPIPDTRLLDGLAKSISAQERDARADHQRIIDKLDSIHERVIEMTSRMP